MPLLQVFSVVVSDTSRPLHRSLLFRRDVDQALHLARLESQDGLGGQWICPVPWPLLWFSPKWMLRSMLLHQGVFGRVAARNPSGYKDVLHAAYEDFGAWRKVMKIGCSQKRFNYNGIFTEEYGAFMNAKGFNARVLAEWLRDVLTRVRTRDWPDRLQNRTLGRWRDIEDDERSWVAEVAMSLGSMLPSKNGFNQ